MYVAGVTDYETILAMAQDHAAECASEARYRQIQGTAKSIHRFMLNGRFGKGLRPGINHGAMSREHANGSRPVWRGLSKKNKQVQSGLRSAAIRKARTTEAIAREVLRVLCDGEVLTQVSLAAAIGLGVRRIQELWGSKLVFNEGALRSVQVLAQRGTSGPDSFILDPTPTLKQLAGLSRERSAFMQAQAKAAQAYRDMAAAMRRPGAEPQAIPPLTSTPRSQELGDAYRTATAAFRDCSRRKENRRIMAECAARRGTKLAWFEAWASAGDAASFTRFIAGVALRWEAREKAAAGWFTSSRELLQKARGSDLKRHWRDWREAWSRASLTTRPWSSQMTGCGSGIQPSYERADVPYPVEGVQPKLSNLRADED